MKPIEPKYTLPAIGFVALLHLAGAALLMFSKGALYSLTLFLIPANLMVTALIAFRFQPTQNLAFGFFLSLGFLAGFLVEVVGVKTGWIFGNYQYGSALGFTILETPVLIGLNWVLLTYCVGCFVHPFRVPSWVKVLIGSSLLVFLDYFMEPVAMKNDFWNWQNGTIPNQNYIGWAACSFMIMLFFQLLPFEKNNKVASRIFLIQFGFFLIQNLF